MMRALWAILLFIALFACAPAANAQLEQSSSDDAEGKLHKPETLDVVALPVFGPGSLTAGGWGEMIVRINNRGTEPVRGKITVFGGMSRWSEDKGNRTDAPFSAGVGSSISVRIPVRVSESDDPMVRVFDSKGRRMYEQSFARATDNRTLLVDVAKASALAAALRGVPVGSRNDPWGTAYRGYAGTSSPSTIGVTSPLYDPVTGDPLLPRRAAGYARVAAILLRSDELVRLGAQEIEALAGYMLSGGTMAMIITRPEDRRHPVVVAFVGDKLRRHPVQPETLRELQLSSPHGGSSVPGFPRMGLPGGGRPPPAQAFPERALSDKLAGYSGGNLRSTPYGASAPYGLGEVHVLAFDPQVKPAVDSPWVHVRIVDMLRRANERVSGVLFRQGDAHAVASEVRRQLDPNESSRWAIVVTALLLCLYSVGAGPINFSYWRRRGKPLQALAWLPIAATAAFCSVVVVGVVAKGCSGRARHLTVVEAGAGMKQGSARRWRGFFVPSARDMTIRTRNSSSVLGVELMSHGEETKDELLVDRDGLRLTSVQLRPWVTLVIREDGYASLGDGIALVRTSGKETKVVNRSGRRLLGLVLSLPGGDIKFLEQLNDGESASSKRFRNASRVSIGSGSSHGLPLRDFNMYAINSRLDSAAPGLTDAWAAVVDAIPARKNWFPLDVPVLLAQLEGGEQLEGDTGLTVDSDRVLVRIVGYGGTP